MASRITVGSRAARPTIRDVARAAGVSTATVSNVLSGQRKVAGELSARVFAVVEQLGYRTDSVAASLRRKRADIVGLIVPDFSNPFFGQLIAHLERLAQAAGYHLLVASSDDRPEQEAEQAAALIGWRASGLLVIPTDDTFAAEAVIRREGVPAVILDRVAAASGCDNVGVENAAAAAEAVRHLTALGHRRILVAASDDGIFNMRERIAGAAAALVEAGLNEPPDAVLTGMRAADAADAVEIRLKGDRRPTAIFALNNVATLGSLQAAARCKLSVPDDVSVVGFDDYEWMQVLHPAITAVRQPIKEMAQSGWDLLIKRLDTGAQLAETCSVRLPCTLMVRDSSAKAADGPKEKLRSKKGACL